jgi:hypothetical protein
MKRKIFIGILSGIIIFVSVLSLYWLNFYILTDFIIGKECNYDSANIQTSKLFDLFYTISSDTGFNPEPSYFNFIITTVVGLGIGIYLSFKLITNRKKK